MSVTAWLAAAGILSGALSPSLGSTSAASVSSHLQLLVPPSEHPLPVVIWASGGSGFFHPRGPWHYVERSQHILSVGYAIAYVDYVTAAGAGEMSTRDIGGYLVAAIRLVESDKRLDPSRIVLLGSSRGGGGVLAALSAKEIKARPPKAALSIYPLCTGVEPWDLDVPVWAWFGGADQITPADHCSQALGNARRKVTTFTFPGAHHGFDMRGLPTELEPGKPALAFNVAAAAELWAQIADVLRSLR